jgi:hypothetical protein
MKAGTRSPAPWRDSIPAPAVLLVSCTDPGDGDEHARTSGARGFLLKGRLAVTDLTRYWSRPPGLR